MMVEFAHLWAISPLPVLERASEACDIIQEKNKLHYCAHPFIKVVTGIAANVSDGSILYLDLMSYRIDIKKYRPMTSTHTCEIKKSFPIYQIELFLVNF